MRKFSFKRLVDRVRYKLRVDLGRGRVFEVSSTPLARRITTFPARIFLALAVLLLLSSGSVLAQGPPPGAGPHARLNLTPEQREKLRSHIRDTRRKMLNVRNDLRDAHLNLNQQFGEYRLDDRRVQETIKRINSDQLHLLNINLESQIQLRSILTREQFQDLREAVSGFGVHLDEGLKGPSGDGPPGDVRRLGLSPEQQAQIGKLFQNSHETMRAIIRRLRADADALRKLYLSYDLDIKQAKLRISSLNDAQLDMLRATAARQVELRKILTEQQFQALSKSVRWPPPADPRRWHRRK